MGETDDRCGRCGRGGQADRGKVFLGRFQGEIDVPRRTM